MPVEKSWIKIVRDFDLEYLDADGYDEKIYTKKILIKDNFEACNTNKLKTTLKDHQKRTVKAMIDLEKIRSVKVVNSSYNDNGFHDFVIETTAGIVSEKPGSGKTYEIFALIAENKDIPIIPEITSLPVKQKRNRLRNGNHSKFDFEGFYPEVRRFYKKIFKPTLIFVGKSVIKQWEEKINNDTYFNAFIINDIFTLRDFSDMVFKNPKKVNTYDIILVKNGNISGKFTPEQLENKNFAKLKTKPILTVFAELFKSFCWTRVVLDDFDNLNIPATAGVIPALFTWLVSATKKAPTAIKLNEDYHSIQEILKNYRPRYNEVWYNKELFTFFNIGCDDDYINFSLAAPIIKYNVYKFKNPNDNFIGLVSRLGNDNIAEMLNGDATGEAAAAVGLVTDSVSLIFEKLLSKSWHSYKKCIDIEKYIMHVKKYITPLPVNEEKPFKQTTLDSIANNLRKPGPMGEIHKIQYQTDALNQTINETEKLNKETKQETGKPIQRVKDKLKENECPITCMPLLECQNVVIMKCCGTALSDEGFKVILSSSKSDCCNCRAKVTKNDVIIISESMGSIGTIVDNIMEDKIDAEPEKELIETGKKIFNEKINTMMNIIFNNDVSEFLQKNAKIEIKDILQGDKDLGFASDSEKKFIIYSGFKESTNNVEEILTLNNIKFAKLQGSVKHIDDIKKQYWLPNTKANSIQVLIISGTQYCAGLDLQNTTDIIFMHKVVDINNELQIAGRAARYGREKNLNVHFLFYQNELQLRLYGTTMINFRFNT